ncbi:hypothetical protein D9M69_586020 [compost metagenome]
MVESSLPITRLSRMLDAPSDWLMLTASLAPMEKAFQLMIARSDACEIASACPPSGDAVVEPATPTLPCVV